MPSLNNITIVEALSVTLLGVLIVFSVLIILMIVLNLMKLFSSPEKKAEPVKATEKAEAIPVAPVQKDADDEEIIAVLTAAIAASLQTSAYNFRIKSYKRVSGKNSGRA